MGRGQANLENENKGSGKPMLHFSGVPDSHKQPDLGSANVHWLLFAS